MARRFAIAIVIAAALHAQRPHWDRIQHFVFVLLPEASFDSHFGRYPDSEGRPGAHISATIPNLYAYADLYALQDHFFAEPDPYALLRTAAARVDSKDFTNTEPAFEQACANESLPQVSLLMPREANDMAYTTRIVNAVATSRLWRRTAIFIAWARTGQHPDHFPPTPGLGPRVPSLAISAWSRLAYNDHRVYSHMSWVRSIENRFNLTPTQSPFPDLYDPFDFSQQPREPITLDQSGARSYPPPGQGQIFPASGWLDTVHRSHGTWTVAPGSLVIGYGDGFVTEEQAGVDPTLATTVVKDATGKTFEALVQYTGKSQVNFVVPQNIQPGLASARIDTARNRFDGALIVESVSPGLFTATAMGQGPADADAATEDGTLLTYACAGYNDCSTVRVPRESMIILRATGIRNARRIEAWVDGVSATVESFGPDEEVIGQDRVRLRVPANVRGRVLVMLAADGIYSNSAQLEIE